MKAILGIALTSAMIMGVKANMGIKDDPSKRMVSKELGAIVMPYRVYDNVTDSYKILKYASKHAKHSKVAGIVHTSFPTAYEKKMYAMGRPCTKRGSNGLCRQY